PGGTLSGSTLSARSSSDCNAALPGNAFAGNDPSRASSRSKSCDVRMILDCLATFSSLWGISSATSRTTGHGRLSRLAGSHVKLSRFLCTPLAGASPARRPVRDCFSDRPAEVDVGRVPVPCRAPVPDVYRPDRRIDAGPDRRAPDRVPERDIPPRVPRVTELDRHPRKGREQREIPDAPVVARAEPGHVLADELFLGKSRQVEEAAEPECAVERRIAADRRIVAERGQQRVPAPSLRMPRAQQQLIVVVVRAE